MPMQYPPEYPYFNPLFSLLTCPRKEAMPPPSDLINVKRLTFNVYNYNNEQ